MKTNNQWGKWLATELKALGLSMNQLQRMTEIDYSTVWYWVNERRMPHRFMRQKVEAVLRRYRQHMKRLAAAGRTAKPAAWI